MELKKAIISNQKADLWTITKQYLETKKSENRVTNGYFVTGEIKMNQVCYTTNVLKDRN
ncbi:hypothetical protein [Solitalea canadensis]|uniref:Uncharacterized protein n=1 Tax=Solitalea canadensis (strain ATCC 29591 / DSM 3403 / JCM 21819 / LMG 8368 / NBRC 15130 / NCIMB 12057 / USAM 9D) TaxID=929556 RepID=H8KLY2_SOLCM|nr:hypothetical protein [Solitalea canadensis]AFD08710.1 hypothetical protein Solca_3709 [Solitalea canadensis DSM 3403]